MSDQFNDLTPAEAIVALVEQATVLLVEHKLCGRANECHEYKQSYVLITALRDALLASRAEVTQALAVLQPSMPESGLVDACRQRMQAYISERDNAIVLEGRASPTWVYREALVKLAAPNIYSKYIYQPYLQTVLAEADAAASVVPPPACGDVLTENERQAVTQVISLVNDTAETGGVYHMINTPKRAREQISELLGLIMALERIVHRLAPPALRDADAAGAGKGKGR